MNPIHKSLQPNLEGRDFLLGDLHGMFDSLQSLMTREQFDPACDRIISVGDLVDRGPDSVRALRLLEKPWFHAVLGNHERMMLDTVFDGASAFMWRGNGGEWADDFDPAILRRIAEPARDMPVAITLALADGRRIGIIHAQYPLDDWKFIEREEIGHEELATLVWGRSVIYLGEADETAGVDLTVHGHTPVDSPTRLGDALFIDTGCVYGGALTLIEVGRALDISQSPSVRFRAVSK